MWLTASSVSSGGDHWFVVAIESQLPVSSSRSVFVVEVIGIHVPLGVIKNGIAVFSQFSASITRSKLATVRTAPVFTS